MSEQIQERRPTASAHLRFVRMGPRKLRRVADAIRGKSVREALVLLKFADVYAAEPIEKLVRSAAANAGPWEDIRRQSNRAECEDFRFLFSPKIFF